MAVAHYLEALDWQREFIKIHAILGGKNPHLQSFLVGGMATPIDPDRQASLNAGSIAADAGAHREGPRLRHAGSTSRTCWPSPPSTRTGPATAPASATTWSTASIRRTTAPNPTLFLPSGRHPQARPREGREVRPREDHRAGQALLVRVRRRGRQGSPSVPGRDEAEVHRARSRPTSGSTTDGKYSWLKSPRYDGEPMEVGPALADARRLRLGPAARQGARRRRPREARRRARGALLDARPRRRPGDRDPGPRREDGRLGQRARRQHGAARAAHRRQLQVGARHLAARRPRAPASTRRPAARSATGSTSATARSPTTSASSRAPGTPGRATPPATAAHTRRRCSAPRSTTPRSRSRSCARCTRSTPASHAASTSSTHSGASSRT